MRKLYVIVYNTLCDVGAFLLVILIMTKNKNRTVTERIV